MYRMVVWNTKYYVFIDLLNENSDRVELWRGKLSDFPVNMEENIQHHIERFKNFFNLPAKQIDNSRNSS